MALRVARDADLGEAMIRRQSAQQRERVGEFTGGLASIACHDEDAADSGRPDRIQDLAQLGAVADQPRGQVRDDRVAEPSEPDGELHGRREAATG